MEVSHCPGYARSFSAQMESSTELRGRIDGEVCTHSIPMAALVSWRLSSWSVFSRNPEVQFDSEKIACGST